MAKAYKKPKTATVKSQLSWSHVNFTCLASDPISVLEVVIVSWLSFPLGSKLWKVEYDTNED